MSLIFNENTFEIIDERCADDKILHGAPLSVCYTLPSDDITKGNTVYATPYTDRTDVIERTSDGLISPDTKTALEVTPLFDGLRIKISTKSDLSEFGINLPFNFMGKIGGGEWKNQFLFNSVYTSSDKSITYAYLSKPNGNNLLVCVLSPHDGWKMDYSPYLWSHYFINLKLLARFDRAYCASKNPCELEIGIFPVSGFDSALEIMSRVYGKPFIDYSVGGGAIGEKIKLYSYGALDSIITKKDGLKKTIFPAEVYEIEHLGQVSLTPVYNGVRGADVTVYGYESLASLYKKAMDSVDLEIIKNHTDSNLCEHQCWASATLRYLKNHGHTLSKKERAEYERKALSLLDIITEQDESKATPRITILNVPHESYPAYNVYKSRRVQELFFGITILLDAFKYFGDEKYLTYAVGATRTLTEHYQKDDGGIYVDWGNNVEDYTTVCSPMIPLVDMGNFLKEIDPELSSRFLSRARKMAEHLYERGIKFPTEGGQSELAQEEMEDGSISCTALCLLYYAKNVENEPKFVHRAKEILDIHESWIIKTPRCQMHGSTLRWWETQWEGDADGPAICAGHAWTIWRAEADYLYYELSGNEEYLTKAQNGFMTNFSKIQNDGTTYSIYNPDLINGGGFAWAGKEIIYCIAQRYAKVPDCGISRYPFIRINDTLLKA